MKIKNINKTSCTSTKLYGFRNLNPTPEEHEQILKTLYVGKNPFEKPEGIMINNNHEMLTIAKNKNDQDFILYNWHIDYPPEDSEKKLCSYIALHMHTFNCEPDAGQTIFISLIDLYKRCPIQFKKKLSDVELIALRGVSENETVVNKTFKAIRTHPITEDKILFWGCGFAPAALNIRSGKYEHNTDHSLKPMVTLNGDAADWFDDLSSWVLNELKNKNNWAIWSWKKNDFIIWDNRALLHTFSGGWEKKDRIFSRSNIGSEEVF